MSAAGSGPGQPGIGALIARRRGEILAGILAAESIGTPDPDETPEYMTECLLEFEARKAFGWQRSIPHEEVMRELLALTYRWDAYQSAPGTLDDGERERLNEAARVVQEVLGIGPEALLQAGGAGVTVADLIACLVLRREQWEPDLQAHPRPWTGPLPE